MSIRSDRKTSRSLSAQLAAVLLAAGSVTAVPVALADDEPTPATESADDAAKAADADKTASEAKDGAEAAQAQAGDQAKAEPEKKRPENPCAPKRKKKKAKNPCA